MMTALELYMTTCGMVLKAEADDASAWSDIGRLLSCLRQALTCCVCEKLLNSPMSPSEAGCQHCVCEGCVGGKRVIKPACNSCSDYSEFTENVETRLVLECYRKLCEYILSSALYKKWGNLNGGTNTTLADLVLEGAEIDNNTGLLTCASPNPNIDPNMPSTSGVTLPPESSSGVEELDAGYDDSSCSNVVSNGNCSLYSVSRPDNNSTKIMIKRTTSDDLEIESSSQDELDNISLRDSSITVEMARSFRPKKKGCRCGLATPNPGKLTCCGQRCPCYVEGKACTQCRCRGCRNPNKFLEKDLNVLYPSTITCEPSPLEIEIESTVNPSRDITV